MQVALAKIKAYLTNALRGLEASVWSSGSGNSFPQLQNASNKHQGAMACSSWGMDKAVPVRSWNLMNRRRSLHSWWLRLLLGVRPILNSTGHYKGKGGEKLRASVYSRLRLTRRSDKTFSAFIACSKSESGDRISKRIKKYISQRLWSWEPGEEDV